MPRPLLHNEFETNGFKLGQSTVKSMGCSIHRPALQADLIVQGYQTQHDLASSSGVQNQYQRLPELDFIGGKIIFGTVQMQSLKQVVNFDYSSDYQPTPTSLLA